jgi:hypothetical protein
LINADGEILSKLLDVDKFEFQAAGVIDSI